MDKQELIAHWIEQNPHRPGPANVQLKESGVSVWALIGHWHAVEHNARRVAEDYDLPREAIEAALAYYDDHKGAIDSRLAANVA